MLPMVISLFAVSSGSLSPAKAHPCQGCSPGGNLRNEKRNNTDWMYTNVRYNSGADAGLC